MIDAAILFFVAGVLATAAITLDNLDRIRAWRRRRALKSRIMEAVRADASDPAGPVFLDEEHWFSDEQWAAITSLVDSTRVELNGFSVSQAMRDWR